MNDSELIDEYIENPKDPNLDYSKHKAAIRQMVSKQLISPSSGIEENPNKWMLFERELGEAG